jgi:glucosamine-6-phosphate deaminase
MTTQISTADLIEWCRIPLEELEAHAQAKVPIKVLATPEDVHRWAARDMAGEVKANNAEGRPTRWILPCGPTKQYAHFAEIVNRDRISLKNVHVFHMDDCLDWQGRPLPLSHSFSYEGTMRRCFYGTIDPDLTVPEQQRHFPSVYAIDAISEAIEKVGGVDTMYGGVGYRGHIAYNEPPRSPWFAVSEDEFRASKTRILHLNEDTLIAVSQRTVGGCSPVVPPMAITMGMKDLLSARRIRLLSDTGAWKQTVVRVLLFGPVKAEYPVTFVQEHSDAMIVVDRVTAEAPLGTASLAGMQEKDDA